MVDLLDIDGGRIVMRDTDGHVVFDTDERLFTATNSVSGSVTLGSYTAQNRNGVDLSFINVDTMHALASINASADTVRGSFAVSVSGGQGLLTGLGYFNASGTYVHFFDAVAPVLDGGGSNHSEIAQAAAYTFVASGGQLYIHERVQLKASNSTSASVTNSITLLAPTLTYNLFVGVFV